MTRSARILSVLAVVALGAGCSGPPGAREASVTKPEAAPAPAAPFWVDPDSNAARQVKLWQREGRHSDAELLRRIADQPVALWPAGEIDPGPQVTSATQAAAKEGRTALFVAYDIPHRDCGQHSAGGAGDAAAYRDWMGKFAAAIGESKALVVLEPDAVAHIVDGCTPGEYHAERQQLLGEAVARLKQQPHTKVYLDAGNPSWIREPWKLVEPLKRSGVDAADGFALNVSNFQPDAAVKEYGLQLSSQLGGKHFVIDTSRNGNGPQPGVWCNPPGRALGTRPTTETGTASLDAYLWIKRPGESDGTCEGGPDAGQWWPEYALELARNSKA